MKGFLSFLAQRRKAIAGLAAVAYSWIAIVAPQAGPVTTVEWVALAGGLLGVVGVHALPNEPKPPAAA